MKVFSLEDILKTQKSSPSTEQLFYIIKLLYNHSTLSSTKDRELFVKLLSSLKSNKSLKKDFQDWISMRLTEYICKSCKNHPSNNSIYPFTYCDSCLTSFRNQLKCLKCSRKYTKATYLSNCLHFCIYCCCSMMRSGRKNCETCGDSFERIDSILDQCDNKKCKSRVSSEQLRVYEHSINLLSCGHSFCGLCLVQITKQERCPIDSSVIKEPQINYLIKTFSDKCQVCKVRKPHQKLVKTECFEKICNSCLKDHLNNA